MRLEPKQPGWVGKHRPWIRPRESFSFQQLEKNFGMPPAKVCVSSTVGRRVAEVTPTFNDLLWRAATDPELEPAIANQIGRTRVLDHIERVFVPHVDDAGTDFDAARFRADRREQRERRREL